MTVAKIERLETGVEGLDRILGGGLVRNSIFMLSGRPGAGKTILSNQVAFAHARAGGSVVYATLLAESHARMIAQLSALSFFDPALIGPKFKYLSAYEAITEGGLDSLLKVLQGMVRDHGASLLVLDGMVTAEGLARSTAEYKQFISRLQSWVAMVECTVLIATSTELASDDVAPAHPLVDGIIELASERFRMRNLRTIAVSKMRGGAVLEGQHSYLISDDGLRVFPRLEAVLEVGRRPPASRRVTTGVPGLDAVLKGGIVSESTTLLLGSSGAGKTILGLHFLAEGARRGEKCLYFGFYEPPNQLIAKADRLGLDFTSLIDGGNLYLKWLRPAEVQIDALVHALLDIVREKKVDRLFIDGFVGFRSTSINERISSVFSAVSDELVAHGVTTVISDETRELFVQEIEVPTPNVSAIFHNILFVRHVEVGAELQRLLSVMKTRDSDADRRLWRYEIEDHGLRIMAPFAAGGDTLIGGHADTAGNRSKAKPRTNPKPSARRKKK